MTLYADDPDVHVIYPITDANQGDINFPAIVRVTTMFGVVDVPDITAEWLGSPAATRDLKVPLNGLSGGFSHRLRLLVPGDRDLYLGTVDLE